MKTPIIESTGIKNILVGCKNLSELYVLGGLLIAEAFFENNLKDLLSNKNLRVFEYSNDNFSNSCLLKLPLEQMLVIKVGKIYLNNPINEASYITRTKVLEIF